MVNTLKMPTLTYEHKRNLVVAGGILLLAFVFLRYGNNPRLYSRSDTNPYVAAADEIVASNLKESALLGVARAPIQMEATGDRQHVTFRNTHRYTQELIQKQVQQKNEHEQHLNNFQRYNSKMIGLSPQLIKTKSYGNPLGVMR